HSEGGVVAPMVAAADPSIAFVVMMAGLGVPGDELMVAQNRALGAAQGMSEPAPANAEQINRKIYDILKSDIGPAEAKAQVAATQTAQGMGADRAEAMSTQVVIPWLRWWVRHDPRPALARLRCPVLAIDGSKDLQVPAAQNLPEIRKALKDDPDATAV